MSVVKGPLLGLSTAFHPTRSAATRLYCVQRTLASRNPLASRAHEFAFSFAASAWLFG
jgi:hypothetical protein